MNIKHPSLFNTDSIADFYSKKDGVPVTYVCTTDLKNSDVPFDVFYRSTPHPEFGNNYFGLTQRDKNMFITDADIVEDFEFGMIKDEDGSFVYSSSHHDCIFVNDKMIDGGRKYIRSRGLDGIYKIKAGEFYKCKS